MNKQMKAMNISVNGTNMTAEGIDGSTILVVIYLVESVFVLTANAIIVFVIVNSTELHIASLWMIAVMGVTDFVVGFYYLIFAVPSAFLNRFVFSDRMLGVGACCSAFLTGQTIFNIALTVLDRYIAVTRPLAYTRIVTTKRVVIAVAVSIILNMCRLLVIVFPDADYYYNAELALSIVDFNTLPTVMASIGFPIVTLAIIILYSCRMYILIKRERNRVRPSDVVLLPQNQAMIPKWVIIATGIFCLTYVPFWISVIWNLVAKKENVPVILPKFAVVAVLSNSFWNVFIYNSTYRPFREALAYLFCKPYFRKQKQSEIYWLHKTANA